jgi:hypothetical protein
MVYLDLPIALSAIVPRELVRELEEGKIRGPKRNHDYHKVFVVDGMSGIGRWSERVMAGTKSELVFIFCCMSKAIWAVAPLPALKHLYRMPP